MNRKSFFKHLSLLGASMGMFARVAEATKAKVIKHKKANFSYDKKIFKLGSHTLKVEIPDAYKSKIQDLKIELRKESQNFENDILLKPIVKDGYLELNVDFKREGRYTICFFDPSDKKKGTKIAFAFIRMYALKDDLYALRPLKGDTHIHSTNSDGKNTPIEVALRCYEVGLDYQAISDHRRWDTSDDMKKQLGKYDTSMSFYHAEECHFAISHIQSLGARQGLTDYINANKAQFDKRVAEYIKTLPSDMPEKLKTEVALVEVQCQIINEIGGISVLNHPYWYSGTRFNMTDESVEALCARKKFDVFEFINFGCKDISTSLSNAKYTELCKDGIKYPIIGTTDAHRISAQGYGYTIAFSKSTKWEDVKDAILNYRSLAVSDTDYGKCYSHLKERMIYGERRLINYAHFLVKEYFPEHDKLVAEEGKLLKEILEKGETKERLAKLKEVSDKSKSLWDSVLG